MLTLARQGDAVAFRGLVLEYSPMMHRLAARLVNDTDLAQDVVQDAFIKAHRHLATFSGSSTLATWLHRITVNAAMDAMRKRKTREKYEQQAQPIDTLEPPSAAVSEDIRRQATAAMQQLTDLERTAFALRHFEGHSIREIAETLDMTANACKQAIFRAVRKMRTALQPLVTA